jgi:allantoate deiminase
MTTDAVPSALRIWEHCEALARCSEQADGLTRVFLSDQQRAANELVLGWMRDAGMSAALDAIGNVVGRYEGSAAGLPALVLGSHLDTVRDAGKYDGMLGVVAAIECVHTLNRRAKRLPFAIEVVGFADEEGVRFGATLLGSRAVAGTFDPALLGKTDHAGVTMREALTRFGLDPALITCAAHKRDDVLAYAELHIEQGPVLEAEGLPVGVVTAINGANRFRVEVGGMAGHAGNAYWRSSSGVVRSRSWLAPSAIWRSHRAPPTSFPARRCSRSTFARRAMPSAWPRSPTSSTRSSRSVRAAGLP